MRSISLRSAQNEFYSGGEGAAGTGNTQRERRESANRGGRRANAVGDGAIGADGGDGRGKRGSYKTSGGGNSGYIKKSEGGDGKGRALKRVREEEVDDKVKVEEAGGGQGPKKRIRLKMENADLGFDV